MQLLTGRKQLHQVFPVSQTPYAEYERFGDISFADGQAAVTT
jgi:hypothetical protein